MSNEKDPGNKLMIPILCALICVVIIAMAVFVTISNKGDPHQSSDQTDKETTESTESDLPSMPLADESSERDNIGFDIFD